MLEPHLRLHNNLYALLSFLLFLGLLLMFVPSKTVVSDMLTSLV